MSCLPDCLSLLIESYAAENQDVVYSIWKNCCTLATYQVESRPRPAFFERRKVMVYQICKYEGMKGNGIHKRFWVVYEALDG